MITLGVDIGSLTGKALILKDNEILAWDLILTGPDSVETGTTVTDNTLKRAQGANWFFPGGRTILDMGGQDCKAIRCNEVGKVTNFVMNDKCAAGAGRSMEIMAELVGVSLEDLGEMSLQSKNGDVSVSSTCVVFARSEVLGYLRQGVPKQGILAAACEALCKRVLGLLRRVGTEEEFVISGGIAKNVGVVQRLEKTLGMKPNLCFEPQIVGALGAAVFAREVLEKRTRKKG